MPEILSSLWLKKKKDINIIREHPMYISDPSLGKKQKDTSQNTWLASPPSISMFHFLFSPIVNSLCLVIYFHVKHTADKDT